MIAILIFLIIVIVVITSVKKSSDNDKLKKILGLIRTGIYFLILVVLVSSCIVQIGPGEVGIQTLFGSVQGRVLYSGLNFVNPLVDVEKMDVKTQAYTMSVIHDEGVRQGDDAITTLSSDGLTLKLDLTVWYRLSAEEAPMEFQSIGIDYVNKIVRPAIRTSIRDVSVLYAATEIYSNKREDFVREVTKNLEKSFQGRGVILERVLLRNVELPEMVRNAIDEKIAAEQKAQQMVYVLQKERQEAERKKVEAQGISDAQKIVSQTITQPYLQYLYIQTMKELTTSQNKTFLIAPFDQKLLPLLDLK
jgi:regulator of protease activity HflC (stomatin/prohibitin superfamily)